MWPSGGDAAPRHPEPGSEAGAVSQHGVRVLSERDRQLLRFIGEQYLVTLPQLASLAGRSERTARWLRTRWQRAGLVEAAQLLVEEPTVVWLTRRGLAAVGLPWKSVRPSYASVYPAAALVELRLAAADRYPSAGWLSRRTLAHAEPSRSPLPDALLTREETAVAIVVKARELDRRELERLVAPLIPAYEHTLLVLPRVGSRTQEWIDEQAWRASAIAFARDPRTVTLPPLPSLPPLQGQLARSDEQAGEHVSASELLRAREALLAEAREETAAFRRRRSWDRFGPYR